jgi:orotate phosphoribosyltransferase
MRFSEDKPNKEKKMNESNVSTFKKRRLSEIFRETGAFQRGDFTLASGAKSNVYVDCRLATLDGEGNSEICWQFIKLMEAKLEMQRPRYVGGVTSGADPIVAGVIQMAFNRYVTNLKGFFVRKEAKDHGTKKQIEGHLPIGADCVIFDDVATTGSSSQIAVDAAKKAGANVVAVMVIVDREAGAKQHFADQGIPLFSLLTLKELEEYLA